MDKGGVSSNLQLANRTKKGRAIPGAAHRDVPAADKEDRDVTIVDIEPENFKFVVQQLTGAGPSMAGSDGKKSSKKRKRYFKPQRKQPPGKSPSPSPILEGSADLELSVDSCSFNRLEQKRRGGREKLNVLSISEGEHNRGSSVTEQTQSTVECNRAEGSDSRLRPFSSESAVRAPSAQKPSISADCSCSNPVVAGAKSEVTDAGDICHAQVRERNDNIPTNRPKLLLLFPLFPDLGLHQLSRPSRTLSLF